MPEKITESQYEEILAARYDPQEFVRLMDKYTGIKVKPYTGYQYFDSAENYIGDSEYQSLSEILEAAEIEVVEDG